MTDDRLERAIDEAVREMMNVDAAPHARARILDRLSAAGRPTVPWRRLTVAAALAAILLAASITLWPRHRVAEPPRPNAVATGPALPHVPAADPSLPVHEKVPGAIDRVPAPTRARIASGAAVSVEDDEAPLATVDPLAAMDGIVVAPLQQRSIAPARIAIAPLMPMDDVSVEPLTPPGERD